LDGLKAEGWWPLEEAVSLFGHPEYGGLPLSQRQRLPDQFVSFIRTGIWLESMFIRLARRIAATARPRNGLCPA
jgi:hypothetical protein